MGYPQGLIAGFPAENLSNIWDCRPAAIEKDVALKNFSDLSEQEILALAITNEEEDSRIYRGFAEGLREQFPSSAKVFDEMAEEEVHHRTMLYDLYGRSSASTCR